MHLLSRRLWMRSTHLRRQAKRFPSLSTPRLRLASRRNALTISTVYGRMKPPVADDHRVTPATVSLDMQTELTSPQLSAKSPASRAVLLSIALVAGFAELAYAVMNISAMPVYLKYSMGYGADAVASIGTAFLFTEGL